MIFILTKNINYGSVGVHPQLKSFILSIIVKVSTELKEYQILELIKKLLIKYSLYKKQVFLFCPIMKSFCAYLYKVQEQKKNSKRKAYILFLLGILQIYGTIITLEMENINSFITNKQSSIVLDFFLIVQYVDIEQLCFTNSIILPILAIISFVIPLFYVIITIVYLNSKNEKRGSKSDSEIKITGASVDIYFWILFQPILTVQFETILFNKQLMNWDDMITNQYTQTLLLFTFTLLGLLLNLLLMIFIILLFYKNQFSKLDYLSCNNPQIMMNIFLLKFTVVLLNSIQLQSKVQYVFYLIILILFITKLYYDHFFGKYEPSFNFVGLNFLYQMFIYVTIGVLFSFLIELTMNFIDFQISYGFYLMAMVAFAINMGKTFEMKIFYYFIFSSKISPSSILLNKIYYYNLVKTTLFIHQPLIIGIIQKHLQGGCECKYEIKQIFSNQKGNDFSSIQYDVGSCFCQQHQLYDARRNIYVLCQPKAVILNFKSFFQFQIKSLFQQHLKNNKLNIIIRLSYATYLFNQIKNKSQALKQLSIINERSEKVSFFDKIQYNLAVMMIQNLISYQNQQSYKTYLDFENVLIIESIIRKIKFKIAEILQNYYKFWKQINNQIDEAELIKQDELIEKAIKNCEQLWQKMIFFSINQNQKNQDKNYLNKKPQWEMMYLWYKRYILNKKMKGQKIEYHPFQHNQQQLIDEDSDSEVDDHYKEAFNSSKVFDTQTAIVVASENGKITKLNENGKLILQIQNPIHINQLIPSSMIRNHMLRVKEFIDKGKSKAIYNRRKILLQNANQVLIPANKYLKVGINQFMSLEYIAMIRPLSHEQTGSYLIINEDWEVVQSTKQLAGVLNKQFNLILSCPKLLLNSSYFQILEKDDYKLFQIKNPERKQLTKSHTMLSDLQKQKSIMNENVFDEIDQQKQFTEQFIKENEDDLEERQRILNCTVSNSSEQHFQLLIRIPMMLQRMQAEYFNLVINAEKENYQDFPEDSIMKTQSIIVKNGKHIVGIDLKILLQKINFLKKLRLSSQLEMFRYLYRKYFCKADSLKKVIRVDAKIKIQKSQLIDKIQIVKVNRFEIFNNIKSKKQSMLLKGNANKKTLKIEINSKPDLIKSNPIQLITIPIPKEQSIQSTDFQMTQRTNLLLNDSQLKSDFSDSQIQEIQLKPDTNLFLKEDHNKIKKHFNKINYFKWTNRYFMVGMILLTMLSFSYGPNCSEEALYFQGANSSYSSLLLGQDVSMTYNILIDLALCNKNQTLCNYLISYYNLENQGSELYNKSQDLYQIQQSMLQFYSNKNLIETLYEITISKHEGENHQNNLLEDLKMFENILKQLIIIDSKEVTFDFDFLQIMQMQVMPGLFESISIIQQNQLEFVYSEFDYRSTFFLVDMIIGFLFLGTLMTINFFNLFKIIDHYQILYCQIQYFDAYSVEIVQRYYQKLKQYFSFLNDQQTNQSNYVSFQSEGLIRVDAESKITLAQKSVQFQISEYWFTKKLRFLLLYFVFMVFLIIMALTYNIVMQLYAYNLKSLISQNSFLEEILSPWAIIFSKEIYLEEAFNIHHIDTIEYIEYLQDFIDDALETDLNKITSSIKTIENYFDQNICDQLNVQNLYCNDVLDGILKRGLIQTYYQLGLFLSSLNNKNFSSFQDVTFDSIFKWNQIQPFLYQQRKNIWKIWIDQFSSLFEYYIQTEVQLIVCFYVFSFLIYLTTLEFYFESQLRHDYKRVRSYYKRYFPNHVLNEQKRIKSLLKRNGLV